MNGRELTLSMGPDGLFRTGNRAGSASIVEVEPGVYSVLLDGLSYEVRLQGGTYNVDGEQFHVQVEDPRAVRRGAARQAEGRHVLTAAMPGKVVRLLVQEGDPVQAGQGMVVVEAMKMQNEVKSPKSGRVLSLPVKEGAAVAAGDTLAVVE